MARRRCEPCVVYTASAERVCVCVIVCVCVAQAAKLLVLLRSKHFADRQSKQQQATEDRSAGPRVRLSQQPLNDDAPLDERVVPIPPVAQSADGTTGPVPVPLIAPKCVVVSLCPALALSVRACVYADVCVCLP